jgi:hypothetical protein
MFMLKLRRALPVTLTWLLALVAACQTPKDHEAPSPFPASWTGIWKGTCHAVQPGGRTNSFAMELHILPTEEPQRMTWKLVYDAGDRRQERDYEIHAQDPAAGHYVVDEKNSILIDSYLVEDTLCCQYSVAGSLITVLYRKEGQRIQFKLISAGLDEASTTGGVEEVPDVSVYPVQIIQTAELRGPG